MDAPYPQPSSTGGNAPEGRGLSLSTSKPPRLIFRGRPTLLVTSGEHYGALINLDFDYAAYLEWLASFRLNLTRLFLGTYVEGEHSLDFAGDERNTLAPRSGRFLAPWSRRGDRFDLSEWEPRYFHRLHEIASFASARDIVIEVTCFSTMYNEYNWSLSPLNGRNNINGAGALGHQSFTTLVDAELVRRQETLMRKLAMELADFDNIYFEVCNEPEDHRQDVRQWLAHMTRVLRKADAGRHLIAASVMKNPGEAAGSGILNFHYTWNNAGIGAIAALDDVRFSTAVLSFNETLGPLIHQSPDQVRVEAWEFLIGGGGIYNGLSWEYVARHSAGAGRGHVAVCKQLSAMRAFLERANLPAMQVDNSFIKAIAPRETSVRAVRRPDGGFIAYMHHGKRDANTRDTIYGLDHRSRQVQLVIDLPMGCYRVFWIQPRNCAVVDRAFIDHPGGECSLISPVHSVDMLVQARCIEPQDERGV